MDVSLVRRPWVQQRAGTGPHFHLVEKINPGMIPASLKKGVLHRLVLLVEPWCPVLQVLSPRN
jgi:hypothetical protein